MIATPTANGDEPLGADLRTPSLSDPLAQTRKLPEDRAGLLGFVRTAFPELHAEDAFEVLTWFAQQRQWVEDPAASDTVVYNFPLLLRIRGPLQPEALRQGLQQVVRRHGVLRSVFRLIEGRLIQIVVPATELGLPVTQLRGPTEERELRMQETAIADAMRVFDFTQDATLRCHLIQLAPDDWALLLVTHNLVYDDWSSGVLINELSGAYSAFAAGRQPSDPDLQFQFGDFVRWQRERLSGPETEEQLDYCKRQLASPNGFEHLKPDFARPAKADYVGAKQTVVLPQAQVNSLMALSRQEHVSPFAVLLAGFKCLLHNYSGDEAIGIATCAANRQLEEVEGLIGRFGNSTLLKTSLAGNPSFSDLFRRVQEVTLEALSRLELPFGTVLEKIAEAGGANGKRLYQTMFILQNAPKERWQIPGLDVEWAPLATPTAKLDLIVYLKTEPKLEISLEYATQVFAPASMTKLLADYQSVLETMAKDPKRRINESPVSARREPVVPTPAPAPVEGTASPLDPSGVKDRMIELWKNAFKPRPVDVTKNFFELGGDSLLAVRLFGQINKAFKCNMPLSVLLEAPTIDRLVQIVVDNTPIISPVLVPIQTLGSKLPLFFVHGSGGEPTGSVELSRCLGPEQPVYGLRSRSLCGEPAQHSIREIAEYYLQCIRGVQAKGPYYLSGFCFGGLVAYEMARILSAQKEDVALVAIFDTPAPGTLTLLDCLNNRIRHDLWRIRRLEIPSSIPIIGQKTRRAAQLAFRSLKVFISNLTGNASDTRAKTLVENLQDVSESNIAAAKAYLPSPYSGQITLFMTPEAVALYGHNLYDRWLAFAPGGVELHFTEGDHLQQLETPYVKSLAQKLEQCIGRIGDPRQRQPSPSTPGEGKESSSPPPKPELACQPRLVSKS